MISERKLLEFEYFRSTIARGVHIVTWLKGPKRWVTCVQMGFSTSTVATTKTVGRAVKAHEKAVVDAKRLYMSVWAPEKYQGEE